MSVSHFVPHGRKTKQLRTQKKLREGNESVAFTFQPHPLYPTELQFLPSSSLSSSLRHYFATWNHWQLVVRKEHCFNSFLCCAAFRIITLSHFLLQFRITRRVSKYKISSEFTWNFFAWGQGIKQQGLNKGSTFTPWTNRGCNQDFLWVNDDDTVFLSCRFYWLLFFFPCFISFIVCHGMNSYLYLRLTFQKQWDLL